MTAALAEKRCFNEQCAQSFIPRARHQLFCGDRCRYKWRDARNPALVLKARERNRRWCAEHRQCSKRQPWLLGPPAYDLFLPGGGFDLRFSPPPKWAIEHRNVRAVHGVVTGLMGVPHDPLIPQFSLIPLGRGSGWGVFMNDMEIAAGLAGRKLPCVLFGKESVVTCGPLHRIRAPRIEKRGRRRLRIDAITPVCVRCTNDHTNTVRMYTAPTGTNLCSTLAAWTPRRLGLQIGPDDVRFELVERETQPSTVLLGDKYGAVRGWVGHCIVETNAVGEWLLRAAETIGLGGRTAFGFGRIKVNDV